MKNKYLACLIISMFVFSFSLSAQKRSKRTEPIVAAVTVVDTIPLSEKVQNSLWTNIYNTREEKCFLHLDKESCLPGDTLWFSGHLFNGATNQLNALSRFIYVELLSRSGVLYSREKISYDTLSNSFVGYIPVSENISQGEYFIRAYSYWMQNNDENYLFHKRIRVISPFDHKIHCEMDVERSSGGKRILKLQFLNSLGERYDNIEFDYKIPGEGNDTLLLSGNTGYSGQQRVVVNDPLSDHIWISFSNKNPWNYHAYLPIPGSKRDYTIHLLPEGGTFVAGSRQRIGIKSTGRDGIGVPVKGHVFDDRGIETASFLTNAMGIGSVEFTPRKGRSYILKATGADSLCKEFPFPELEEHGLSLRLDFMGNEVCYSVNGLNDTLLNANEELTNKYILIHSKGVPLAVMPLRDSYGEILNLSGAPEGITHFVLLDSALNVLSERLWYNEKALTSNVDISLPNGTVGVREEQPVSIHFEDQLIQDESIKFSVSVVNNGQTSYDSRGGDIRSYILLTSDAGEFIENPNYYLNSTNTDRHESLDNLMLTLKWRRFNIRDILHSKEVQASPYYIERGQFLSGVVYNFMHKPVSNAKIIIVGSNGIARESITDSLGHFVENELWFDEGTRFYVQALRQTGKDNVEMQIDEAIYTTPKSVEPIGVALYQNDADFYKSYSKDYIFSDNGERLTTIGDVRIGGMSKKKQQEIVFDDFIAYDMRQNFLLGHNDVINFGAGPGMEGASGYRYYQILKDWIIYGIKQEIYQDDEFKFIVDPYIYPGNITDVPGMTESFVKRWNQIEKNTKLTNETKAETPVYRSFYDLSIVGSRYKFSKGTLSPVSINIPPRMDYQWNIQTLIPFAPQINSKKFEAPSYNVKTELLKDPIDEQITRYWNPSCELKNGNTMTFSFPTAAGLGNTSYTVVVDGVTSSGNLIYKTYIINL